MRIIWAKPASLQGFSAIGWGGCFTQKIGMYGSDSRLAVQSTHPTKFPIRTNFYPKINRKLNRKPYRRNAYISSLPATFHFTLFSPDFLYFHLIFPLNP